MNEIIYKVKHEKYFVLHIATLTFVVSFRLQRTRKMTMDEIRRINAIKPTTILAIASLEMQ